MRDRIYPGKVLLFGEYTILWDGMALSIPYRIFFGKWLLNVGEAREEWSSFLDYIQGIQHDLHNEVDTKEFRRALEKGWSLQLQIPSGKGLGSSGVVSAAFLDFFLDDYLDLSHLKKDLALIESYFHGKSSGLDALVSLLDKPVLATSNSIEAVDLPSHFQDQIYLVDTGISRATRDLVPVFKKEVNEIDSELLKSLSEMNEQAIHQFRDGESTLETVRLISDFQLNHMRFLIPQSVLPFWEACLDNPTTGLKLCGAGGGGYLLLFSQEKLSTDQLSGMQLLQLA